MPRAVRATLIAPLVVPLLYWIWMFAPEFANPQRRSSAEQNLTTGLMEVFVSAAPIAYAATLSLALPVLWLTRSLRRPTVVTTVGVGLVVGFGVAIGMAPFLRTHFMRIPLSPLGGALLGAAAALVCGGLPGSVNG